ncbi:MAG: spore coat protein [Bacillaceae bacterium]|nr:spore coat protein [Bacillaceae bacterium]
MQTQNPNQISNPKDKSIEQPSMGKQKTPEMNDRDRINDALVTEKYLTDSFNTAAREASHEALHRDYMTILNETHQLQYEMYLLMFRKGAYKLEAEQQQHLDQAYQQFSGYASQFPYSTTQIQ